MQKSSQSNSFEEILRRLDAEAENTPPAEDSANEKDGKMPACKMQDTSLARDWDNASIANDGWWPFSSNVFMKEENVARLPYPSTGDDDPLFPHALDAHYLEDKDKKEYEGKGDNVHQCLDRVKDTQIEQSDGSEMAADTARRVRVHGMSPPTLPGAVWEGGSHNGDGEMASFSQQDPELTIPVQQREPEEILVRANVVDDPVLVSASQVTCTCNGCPYGPLTALPPMLASIGSCCNWLSGYVGYFYTEYIDILSCVLGGVGANAIIASANLGCKTFSSRGMRIISGVYMLLAITSLFTILTMRRGYSNSEIEYSYFTGKIALAVVAFYTYIGAAASTMDLDKRMQSNRIPTWSCFPFGGQFTALSAVLGIVGSAFTFVAVFAVFAVFAVVSVNSDNPYIYDRYLRLYKTSETEDTLLKFAGVLGYISACSGVFCFLASIMLSCSTPKACVIKILGSIYITLGVMSLLMLVALTSETCSGYSGCTLGLGGIFAIVAFGAYIGAGISTFYLNRTRLRQMGGSPS